MEKVIFRVILVWIAVWVVGSSVALSRLIPAYEDVMGFFLPVAMILFVVGLSAGGWCIRRIVTYFYGLLNDLDGRIDWSNSAEFSLGGAQQRVAIFGALVLVSMNLPVIGTGQQTRSRVSFDDQRPQVADVMYSTSTGQNEFVQTFSPADYAEITG